MYGFGGWIRKEHVAVCPSHEDWDARREPEDFLVVTGREIRLNKDRGCEELSNLLLPMGTVLPLVKPEDAPESIDGRYSYNSYIVRLPIGKAVGIGIVHFFLQASGPCLFMTVYPLLFRHIEGRAKRTNDEATRERSRCIE